MKKIFLTGASSGIGKAIALALSERGDEVWGTSRDPSRIPNLPRIHAIQLDLADSNSIQNAFAGALAEAGHFDVVINNAGSGHFGPAEHLTDPEIEKLFRVLVFGHLQLLRLALAAMRSREQGLIINVTSLASRLPVPFMAAYNAAKAAMGAFTMSIQLELPDSGTRIVDLQPADICTEFNDSIQPESRDPRYETRLAKTWAASERNMKNAPKPDLVAKHVLKVIDSTNSAPRITVGDVFQSKIAPFIFRFLPQRLRIWGIKKYYEL